MMASAAEYNAYAKRRSGTANGSQNPKQLQDIENNNDFDNPKQ
jgi:proline iminopeptidase